MLVLWNMLSKKTKIIVIILGLVFLSFGILFGKMLYYKNKYINEKLAIIKELELKVEKIENQEIKEIKSIKSDVIKSKQVNKNIKQKLKNDEDSIDNRDVTSDELTEFLSSFED